MDRSIAIIIFLSIILLVFPLINSVSSDKTFVISKSFSCMVSNDTNTSISYLNNVNNLYSDFANRASQLSYYNTSVGNAPHKVYGYYMCRGDITSQVCYDCITNATLFAIEVNCEHEEGIYYSEICMFQYSNHSMYGVWEQLGITVTESTMASMEPKSHQYNKTLANITEAVIDKAASGCNIKDDESCVPGFATIEGNVTQNETIYSLAQCTPDIVGVNCSKCLHLAFADIKRNQGAHVFRPNCQLMYDNSSFYPLPKAIPPIEAPSSSTSPDSPLDSLASCIPPSILHSWLSKFVLVSCIYLMLL